jgi:hypothetical protein
MVAGEANQHPKLAITGEGADRPALLFAAKLFPVFPILPVLPRQPILTWATLVGLNRMSNSTDVLFSFVTEQTRNAQPRQYDSITLFY